jgi:hypothetical protein
MNELARRGAVSISKPRQALAAILFLGDVIEIELRRLDKIVRGDRRTGSWPPSRPPASRGA